MICYDNRLPYEKKPYKPRVSIVSLTKESIAEINNNNNVFISYIKYTNITPPANSKANRGRWCVDGLRFITIVEVKKEYHNYNKKGQSREKLR